MQRERLELNESEALQSLLDERFFQVSSLASQICQTRALLEVESRHSLELREEECCLYPQHEHISRVSFLVCLSVFTCTPVHSNSLTISTDSLACIAGALTKQLSVLLLSKHVSHTCLTLSSNTCVFHNRKLFRKAEELELQSWLDHRVFDLVKRKFVDQERVMRARWVLAWKSTGKAKARLCVLGFQDPDLTEVPRGSPTLSAASEALIMQWVASHKYRLISGDIKTAFLRGDEDIRNIFISPLDDVRQMLNLDHETVLRLRKAVYGLVNAPKKWWDRLKTSLIKHGFTSCALDPCAFVFQKSGKIHGVLGVHVDDVIGGGNETFDRIMTAVRKEFDFGAWDVGNFRFKGRQISKMPN